MKLYCAYNVERWLEREGDPPEVAWGDRDCYGGRYSVTGVHLSGGMRDEVDCLEEVKVGDLVHVVYVSYSDGDTFGYDGGYGYVVAATTDSAKAQAVEAWVTDSSNPLPEGVDSRRPWSGYFSGLDHVGSEIFEVKP